ncbi:hypothetical protein PSACC_01479, partial [Paramicrosporidium saccamoebae]
MNPKSRSRYSLGEESSAESLLLGDLLKGRGRAATASGILHGERRTALTQGTNYALLIFLCTFSRAVGWALTLLDPEHVHFSSTCQTVGLNSGYFVSFTVFLALNSAEFWYIPVLINYSDNYLRSEPLGVGVFEISSFLRFWGWASILGTLAVALMKREPLMIQQFVPKNIAGAYGTVLRIVSLPNVRRLGSVLLLWRIGFLALDAIAPLKLIERGFPREKLAMTVLIDFPCQIVVGFVAARWSQNGRPLWAWQHALYFKLTIAVLAMFVLAGFPTVGVGNGYFLVVTLLTVVSSFASTVMFVSMSSFFSMISDPAVGGTYMTLLNTLTNLGGVWPKLFLMAAVDWFTVHKCVADTCTVILDGYYIVNTVCVMTGMLLTRFYLIPAIRRLEMLPLRVWQINTIPGHLVGL